MTITYGSVCSGIEAATAAWHPLGYRARWLAEIEPFPSAVLAHHYPDVPNLGDMTKLGALVLAGNIEAPDVLVGGTPCQAFSVAGMREGLADPRGVLTIKYVELADAIDHVRAKDGRHPCVTVWENVPGVLSDKGNAFGCFLGALAGEDSELQPSGKKWSDAGCVYGPARAIAWRILDAQYFGLAQRRRRVFVVASARNGFDPAAVLFEREGVRRDTAPRRSEGQYVTGAAPSSPALRSGGGHVLPDEPGPIGCPNCKSKKGPAASMLGGTPAFGGYSLGGSATLTAKDGRMDLQSGTFFVQPAGTLRSTDGGLDVDHARGGRLIRTLQASGKMASSAPQQDAEAGLPVVHGTQTACISPKTFTLGRNSGQENAVFNLNQFTSTHYRSQPKPSICHTLPASSRPPISFSRKDHGADAGDIFPVLRAMRHSGSHASAGGQVAACITGEVTHTLKAGGLGAEDGTVGGQPIVSVALRGRVGGATAECGDEVGNTLRASTGGGDKAHALIGSSVRRLTPRECERLQGFRDDYTLIPWRGKPASECPDGPRYKAIGNSKAVPVVRWIGRRIQQALE